MSNEINFLEYKQKKEKFNNIKDDKENEDFLKYEKNIDWLIKTIRKNNKFKPTTNEQISFFKWLLSITNDYCVENYVDLSLFDENNYFYTLINLIYKDIRFSIKTYYYHNSTEVEVIPLDKKEENNENFIDLDWIRYDIKPPNYEKMKKNLVEEDIKNICDLYDIDIDYLKNIINKIK